MASSSYYYRKYKQYKAEEAKYASWLKELSEINRVFAQSWTYEDYADVNRFIGNCRSNMEAALDGDSAFDQRSSILAEAKERSMSEDYNLGTCITAVRSEKERIEGKRQAADQNKDYYWREYKRARARELAEAAAKLAGG